MSFPRSSVVSFYMFSLTCSYLLSMLYCIAELVPVLHEFDNICDIRGFLHSGKQEQFLSLDFGLPTA